MSEARWRPVRKSTTVAFIVLSACGKVIGIDDYRVSEPDAAAAPKHTGACGDFRWPKDSPCAGCNRDHCCTEAEACRKETDGCAKLVDCFVNAAGDSAKLYDCFNAGPKTAASGDLLSCWAGCGMDGASCVGNAGISASFGPGCTECYARASQAISKCNNDADCRHYVACLAGSVCEQWTLDPGCRAICAAREPVGRSKFTEFAGAVSGCSTECGWGRHWECAGKVKIPTGVADMKTEVTVKVMDTTFSPLPDASVMFCHSQVVTGPTCPQSLATGPEGTVKFSIDQGPGRNTWGSYFDTTFKGAKIRAYPGRNWAGASDSFTVVIALDPNGAPRPPASRPGTGLVIVFAADCIGSLTFGRPDTAGPTMTIDSGEPAGYVDPSHTISPEFRSGLVVHFLDVAAGPHTVVVHTPDGTPFDDPPTIDVIADGATQVYANLPAVL